MAINKDADREIIDMFTYVSYDIDVYIFTIHPDHFRSVILPSNLLIVWYKVYLLLYFLFSTNEFLSQCTIPKQEFF